MGRRGRGAAVARGCCTRGAAGWRGECQGSRRPARLPGGAPRPRRRPGSPPRTSSPGWAAEPCPDGSEFTCATVPMPLDHFDPSDTRTIDVTFAVKPATGARRPRSSPATGRSGLLRHQRGRLLHVVLRAQRAPPVRPHLLRFSGAWRCPGASPARGPRRPTTGPIPRPARPPRSGPWRPPPAASAPTARSRPAAPICCPTWARRRRPRTSSRSGSSSRTTGGPSTASRTAPSSPRPTPPPTRSTSAGSYSTARST